MEEDDKKLMAPYLFQTSAVSVSSVRLEQSSQRVFFQSFAWNGIAIFSQAGRLRESWGNAYERVGRRLRESWV